MRTIVTMALMTGLAVGCGVEQDPVDVRTADDSWERATPPPTPGRDVVYESCGDPVCSGWRPKGLPGCGPFQVGDNCPAFLEGRQCDPGNACNTVLQCDSVDPFQGPCPISLRSAKHDIDYVSADRRHALAKDLMSFRLAEYTYNEDPVQARHLGFIIDDVGSSPAVASNGQRVDVYGYATMAVAALQEQQAQIDVLKAEIAALKADRATNR
ncbi:MAG: hypothetical protein KC621_27820 [Myxococcales bacterium]|nr:hypothetical protein [Myxococcales bacterium]